MTNFTDFYAGNNIVAINGTTDSKHRHFGSGVEYNGVIYRAYRKGTQHAAQAGTEIWIQEIDPVSFVVNTEYQAVPAVTGYDMRSASMGLSRDGLPELVWTQQPVPATTDAYIYSRELGGSDILVDTLTYPSTHNLTYGRIKNIGGYPTFHAYVQTGASTYKIARYQDTGSGYIETYQPYSGSAAPNEFEMVEGENGINFGVWRANGVNPVYEYNGVCVDNGLIPNTNLGNRDAGPTIDKYYDGDRLMLVIMACDRDNDQLLCWTLSAQDFMANNWPVPYVVFSDMQNASGYQWALTNTDGTLKRGLGSFVAVSRESDSDAYTQLWFKNADLSYKNQVSGSFKATLFGGTTAGTTTYTAQEGTWVRTGKLCKAAGRIVWTNATGTGNARIGGFPFKFKNMVAIRFSGGITYYNSLALPAAEFLLSYGQFNDTYINLITGDSATSADFTQMSEVTTSGEIYFDIEYEVEE